MNNPSQKDFNFCSLDMISFIWQNKKPLLIVSFFAIVFSVIVSYSIVPEYKAKVVLFPSTSISISKSLLSSSSGFIKEAMAQFGEDEDAERILQVLKSDAVREEIIKKYDLFNHYNIDSNKVTSPRTKIYREFDKNFNFQRTKYMGIEIIVMDKDPKLAADMANYAASLIDKIMNYMYRERSSKAFDIVRTEYESFQRELSALQDSMTTISKYGVTDYESQSEVFNAALAKAIAEGNHHAVESLEKRISVLEEYGAKYLAYKSLLEEEAERFSLLKSKYAEAKVDANQDIPYKYIVDNAYEADSKSYPIRWLIVAATLFSTLFLALIVLIIIHRIKEVKIN